MALELDKEANFPFLALTKLNSATILASCGSKLSQLLRLTYIRDLIQEAGRVPQTQPTMKER
jgi:hypothetical protein